MKPARLSALSPFSRILFFLILAIVSIFGFFIVGLMLAPLILGIQISDVTVMMTRFDDPAALDLLRYLQIIQTIGLFIVPSLLAAWFFGENPAEYLGAGRSPGIRIYILSLLVLALMAPFVNWTIAVNEAMKLPPFLAGMEEWMKSSESQAADLTEALLSGTTVGALLFNLVLIALLPALGEELVFRGVLQRLFREWTGNIHLAIFISAFLFTTLHLQFYGFLPRLFLGMVLGYLFYWTGSLWVPIFFHFLNNASAIAFSFLEQKGWIGTRWEDVGATDNVYLIIGSALLTAGLMWWIYRVSFTQRRNGIAKNRVDS